MDTEGVVHLVVVVKKRVAIREFYQNYYQWLKNIAWTIIIKTLKESHIIDNMLINSVGMTIKNKWRRELPLGFLYNMYQTFCCNAEV